MSLAGALRGALLPGPPDYRAALWLWVFAFGMLASLAGIAYYHVAEQDDDGLFGTVLLTFRDIGSILPTVTLLSYLVEEVVVMIAEPFLNWREAKGEAKGRAAANKKWIDWNRRREAAESRGENPPPPPATDDAV